MISSKPSTFVEGALLDDVDAKILEAGTCLFDYDGKSPNEVPALRVVYGHGEGYHEVYIQHYSAGDVRNFVPSTGEEALESPYGAPEGETRTMGMGFDQVGDKGFLNKGSNTGMLLASLVNSGFPEDKLTGNYYADLTGTVVHLLRQPMPERKGLANPEGGKKDRKFPDTILLVSEVKALPGAVVGKSVGAKGATAAKPAAPKTAAAKPATTPPAQTDAAGTEEYDEKLQEFLVGALAEKGGTLKKKELVPLIFSQFAKDTPPLRNYGVKRAVDPAFLAAGPWHFEADVLSL